MYKKVIEKGDRFNFLVSEEKICVGYPDRDDNIIPCEKSNIIQKGEQCFECRGKDPLTKCSICRGIKCVNPKAWDYCQSVPHVVYLAGYAKNTVKVGTAKQVRFERRILEQGASIATIIAKIDTQIKAKYIEHLISKKMAVTDRVNKDIKIASLAESDIVMQKSNIKEVRDNISKKMDLPELKANEPIQEFYTENFKGCTTKVNLTKKSKVKGKVKFIRGRYIILEDSDTYFLLNLFKLRGKILEIAGMPKVEEKRLTSYLY